MAGLYLIFAQLLRSYAPNGCPISVGCPPVESDNLELSNTLICNETWLSFLKQLISSALITSPPSELGVGSVLLWQEAVTGLYLVFAQLLKSCALISLGFPPVKSNTLELLNALLCHATWLSFLQRLILSALIPNPPPELGVGSVPSWHEAVAGLYLVFAQLLKSCALISLGCPPVESNTLQLSNALLCHATWLSLIQLAVVALSRSPLPERGVCRVS